MVTDVWELMRARHSVRNYLDRPIEGSVKAELEALIAQCNRESGLHIQLVTDEPNAFNTFLAHYGKFSGVKNYLALVGKDGPGLEENCGYYGEKLVLEAQRLGLNTCWTALTFSRKKACFAAGPGEKLCIVIAIGYGAEQGRPHRSRAAKEVMQVSGAVPPWFAKGVEAALLAPTAINQQKFLFALEQGAVCVKALPGPYSGIDLGIVKYHFELGAGADRLPWKE